MWATSCNQWGVCGSRVKVSELRFGVVREVGRGIGGDAAPSQIPLGNLEKKVCVRVCVQYVRVCDGGGRHPVDPGDPGHAGSSTLLLHPGHQRIPCSANRQCLPTRRALASRQRTGNDTTI